MIRQRLPNRRAHELVNFEHEGQRFVGGIGRFDDGRIAEMFINGHKFGSAAEATAQEAALVASLALQFGCPFERILHSVTRDGIAAGPLGALMIAVMNG